MINNKRKEENAEKLQEDRRRGEIIS